jgi:hypothetical protein
MEQDSEDGHIDARQWLLPDEIAALMQKAYERGRVFKDEGTHGGIQYRTFSDPLDYYWRKRLISALERRAGNKLASIHRRLPFHGRYVCMRYGEEKGAPDPHGAAQRGLEFGEAFRAIKGTRERKLAYYVCCEGTLIGRGNVVRLQNALTDLATYFGMD